MNNYRSLLLELSNNLTSSDLEQLKFLCREVIPAGRAERITRPFEFFSALEQLNMLSEENRDFLASKLIAINRNDLRNKLLGIQGDQNTSQFGQGAITPSPFEALPTGLYDGIVPDDLVHDLVEDLSTSWRMLGRRLGLTEGVIKNIDSEYRRVIDKGVAMFDEWKNRKTTDATMQALRDGLEKIGRRDLSEKVRDFALRNQQELITAAAEHEQRPIETVEERRPFPNLNNLHPVLPNYPPLPAGMRRQPQEQIESNQRPLAAPNVRDPPFSMPPAPSGRLDQPDSIPGDAPNPWFPAHQRPPAVSNLVYSSPQSVRQGASARLDPSVSMPAAVQGFREPSHQRPSAASNLRDPSPPVPQASSGHWDPPVSPPVGTSGPSNPSLQRPPAASTLADPSLPFPVPISQPSIDDSSLPVPAAAAPSSSSPPPIGINNSSTDVTRETPAEANSRQVHGPANAAGLTGQDITDHGPNNSTRTSVPVESAPRLQLTFEGSFLDPEKYEPVRLLGSGGFAKVYLCISKETGRRMAVKMCDLGVNHRDTQKQTEAVAKEVKILSAVKHQHIVEFLYVEESHHTLSLFLEYMEGGSVEELLRHKGAIQEPLVRKFTQQILTAVDFLHNRGIIHKDIKGGNVLLDGPQKNIKLADFGISTVMDKLVTATGGLMTNNTVASFHWTSPELLSKKPFGRNTDIWSVGCTVVQMLTTKPPLMEEDLDWCQRMFKIVSLDVHPPHDCSSLAYGFLTKCLCASDVRPSAAELLQTDPFVNFTPEERIQLAWLFT